jgi:lipid-A-disaccharide synthase-like uncharacterized protein
MLNVEENNQGTVGFLFTMSFLMGLFHLRICPTCAMPSNWWSVRTFGTRYSLTPGIFHYPYQAQL